MNFDLLIRNGMVYDGTGAPAQRADVAILGDGIAVIGDLPGAEARETIDAAGRIVCPGFIDAHSHSDAYLLIEPNAPSKIFQGVTTEVVGNCGASAAPRLGAYQMPSDWADKGYPRPWSSFAEYRALLEEVKPAVNVVALIGHKAVRTGVMGFEPRHATADEVRAMERVLDTALAEGGAGFSTGLVYAPGQFAAREEISALAAVAARRGKIYTSHMRSEGARLLESLDETIAVARQTGGRVQVSHLKTSGRANWPLVDAALERMRAAIAAGLPVAADRYPYTASSTDLDVLLPDWAAGGGREAVLARLRDPETRTRLRAEILARRQDDYWNTVLIGSTHHPDNARFKGRRLPEIAAELGMEPVDAALRLMETDELHTGAIFFGMSEANMWRILAEPYVMIGSDASLRAPTGVLSKDFPHPRAYGAFPLFLRAALDGKTVPVAAAICKMTSLPAQQFELKDRGVLAQGCRADILVIDPARLRDRATYAKPHQLSEGVECVIVNGAMTLQAGKFTGRRAGRLLG